VLFVIGMPAMASSILLSLWHVGVGTMAAGMFFFLFLGGFGALLAATVLYDADRRAAARRMKQHRFSWCASCEYPFDERTDDDAKVTCTE